MVDEARWKVIVATGAGATVAEVGDRLGLGEIGISKAVKEVVEIGLLTISDAPMTRAMASVVETAPIETHVFDEPVFDEPVIEEARADAHGRARSDSSSTSRPPQSEPER